MEINSSKVQNKPNPYNYEVLVKVLSSAATGISQEDDREATSSEKGPTDSTKPEGQESEVKPRSDEWRNMPDVCMEEMIISSYGDEFKESLNVVGKIHDNTVEDKEMPLLARKELDTILDKCNAAQNSVIKYFCTDFPRAQFSREYYLDRIKLFLSENKTDGATIWYTGNSEIRTGNWCFKDGVVTFDNIFGLYMDHFKGKRLTVICDCSYSGQWIIDAVSKMDEIGIPSCGHHTRIEGILLKVFASCQPNEEASALAFLEKISVKNGRLYLPGAVAGESGQTPLYGDFRSIRCRKKEDEPCEIGSNCTWKDRIISQSKHVFLVRGKDKGRPAWHFVLVDEEKLDTFKVKIGSGKIDVADYGRVIISGWGKDPPKEKTDMIDQMFLNYIPPD